MGNFYINRFQDITMAIVLVFSSFCSTCFAQEKLPNSSFETTKLVKPEIYSQSVTNDRTSITGRIELNPDSPRFIQKYSQDNSVLSSQAKSESLSPTQSENVFRQGSLPVEKSAHIFLKSLTLVSCGDTPIGTNDRYVTANDKALTIVAPGFLANDIDLEGETLTATLIVDDADHGSLTAFGDGSFNYTPTTGYIGTDQFQYIMRDASNNNSDPVTVTIEVLEAGNRTPIGADDEYGALAGTVLNIAAPGFLANDIDQDGDVLTATLIVDDVDHGSLTAFGDGSFNYTPNAGFTGTDQFQYQMRDSKFYQSGPITVLIQVFEGNRSPLGVDDIFGVVQNTTLSISAPGFLINDVDPDEDALTATLIVDDVDHGSLTAFGDGSFNYTPNAGFTGTDQFQYQMRDSKFNQSGPVTVTLEVVGTGTLPFGFPDNYQTADKSTLSIAAPGFLINDIDQNGEALTATLILDDVDHGSLTAFGDGSFTYTPNAGFTGTDQFQYKMRDASFNQSEAITVTIVVGEPYNRTPKGTDDQYSALKNTTLTIASPGFLANDVDQDGDVLTATLIVDDVDHGSLTAFGDGSFNYTPNPGFTGTDQFKYEMRDSKFNQSGPITVTINVYEGNRSPLGINDEFAVIKNTQLNIAANGFLMNDYDADGDVLTATLILDDVDHGSLTAFGDGSFSYTPDPDFIGTDQFQYKMQDSEGNQSDAVTVLLEVVGTNLPPIASAVNINTECTGPSGTMVTLDGTGSNDPEAGALMYTWYENSLIIAGPTTSATSDLIFTTGVHQVTLEVEDECGQTSQTDISVTIEDTSAPLVEAAFLESSYPHEFEISCSSEDVCSEIISSVSVILIPDLVSPTVTLKNNKNYSLEIDMEKNTVSVKAPNAAAFWASVIANGGVEVDDGQVISAKSDKNKYKFSFDAAGNLVSVEGDIVTLRCTATDSNGNTGESEATIPSDKLKSVEINAGDFIGEELMSFHRNYPNPFDRYTTIEFKLENSAFVNVTVFDQTGRKVEQLLSKQMPEGIHEIRWDVKQNNPGIYMYRIEYDRNVFSDKMILKQ